MRITLKIKNSRDLRHRRCTTYCDIYFQELNQVPILSIGVKSLRVSTREKGKESF